MIKLACFAFSATLLLAGCDWLSAFPPEESTDTALAGTAWTLHALEEDSLVLVTPRPAVGDGPYTIHFQSEGSHLETEQGFTGGTGCNGFAGSYQTGADGQLEMEIEVITLASCGHMMEARFLGAIDASLSYLIDGDELRIRYDSEKEGTLYMLRMN